MKVLRIIVLIFLLLIIIPYDLSVLIIDDITERKLKRQWLKEKSNLNTRALK